MTEAEHELQELRNRIRNGMAHPSHVFCEPPLVECVHCEMGRDNPRIVLGCENTNANKTEHCCECGAEYPRSDLMRGKIFCPQCRKTLGGEA